MSTQHHVGVALLLGLMALGLGCGGSLQTGTAKRPTNNKPADDGTCPGGDSLCGTGAFAICVDLQADPNHCGACDHRCSPGIACQAGVCQQVRCTGTTIPFSGQPIASGSTLSVLMLPYHPQQILADVNGDGQLDLVGWVAGFGIYPDSPVDMSEFHVSLGQPGGGFGPPDTYRAADVILRMFATDVNADGFADIYVISSTYQNSAVGPQHIELWLGQNDGRLTRADAAGMTVDGISMMASEISIGDLSGDGWPDLIMQEPHTDYPGQVNVYLSDSTGALHLSRTYVANWIRRTFIRDWNGDGSPDIALLSDGMEILYNRGDGTFMPAVDCALSLGIGGMNDVLAEDFNQDGWMDLALLEMGNKVGVMLGFGGCGFTPIDYYEVPGSSTGFLRAADMNGDGILDIVSISAVLASDPNDPTRTSAMVEDNLLTVLLGHPDGTFQVQDGAISLGPLISDVAVGDLTGDGRPDILVASGDEQTGQIGTWENTCQ